MVLYIGLDPATSFGWAVLDEEGNRVDSGIWAVTKTDKPSLRFLHLEQCLRELIGRFPSCVVGYDLVQPYGSGTAKAMYYKCLGSIERVLDEAEVTYVGVRPGTYKKKATDRGNCTKEKMVEAALLRWTELATVPKLKDDEADALWIAECVRLGNY